METIQQELFQKYWMVWQERTLNNGQQWIQKKKKPKEVAPKPNKQKSSAKGPRSSTSKSNGELPQKQKTRDSNPKKEANKNTEAHQKQNKPKENGNKPTPTPIQNSTSSKNNLPPQNSNQAWTSSHNKPFSAQSSIGNEPQQISDTHPIGVPPLSNGILATNHSTRNTSASPPEPLPSTTQKNPKPEIQQVINSPSEPTNLTVAPTSQQPAKTQITQYASALMKPLPKRTSSQTQTPTQPEQTPTELVQQPLLQSQSQTQRVTEANPTNQNPPPSPRSSYHPPGIKTWKPVMRQEGTNSPQTQATSINQQQTSNIQTQTLHSTMNNRTNSTSDQSVKFSRNEQQQSINGPVIFHSATSLGTSLPIQFGSLNSKESNSTDQQQSNVQESRKQQQQQQAFDQMPKQFSDLPNSTTETENSQIPPYYVQGFPVHSFYPFDTPDGRMPVFDPSQPFPYQREPSPNEAQKSSTSTTPKVYNPKYGIPEGSQSTQPGSSTTPSSQHPPFYPYLFPYQYPIQSQFPFRYYRQPFNYPGNSSSYPPTGSSTAPAYPPSDSDPSSTNEYKMSFPVQALESQGNGSNPTRSFSSRNPSILSSSETSSNYPNSTYLSFGQGNNQTL